MAKIQSVGVMTSGGDSPGMNAAIRAVVRTGVSNGLDIYGIYRGYEGLIDGTIEKMGSRSVSNIIQRGGTILKSARSQRFLTEEGRRIAYENLQKNKIDALVVIGGNGTFTGAIQFASEYSDYPIIGLPGTIDNDLYGTDFTIGFDTAVNTVLDAADKIRDTATSHDRLFFIEVMGRDSGYLALYSGIAAGAEFILVPETKTYPDNLARVLKYDMGKNKTSGIVIVAEGDDEGGAYEIAAKVRERLPHIDTRVTILGHIQRGGAPTANDRNLASILGYSAIVALLEGKKGVMAGMVDKNVVLTSFEEAVNKKKEFLFNMLEVSRILAI
ncbi:MAG TPA: 6-phosphofructokinase [Bacteroidales bacterium]|nr:6-phosphofructokinase [Bacteroidales bacterium]HPS72811.1 6-phosphofructokinase [Bacteroidales bacterium]